MNTACTKSTEEIINNLERGIMPSKKMENIVISIYLSIVFATMLVFLSAIVYGLFFVAH